MFKNYSSYLFDLDGTLIDTIELIVECFKYSLDYAAGLKIPENEIKENVGLPLKEQFKIYLGHFEDIDYEDIMQKHMQFQLKHYTDYLTLHEGAYEILEYLKEKNKKLAIVTSRREQTTSLYTKYLNIAKYFDLVITPENSTHHKPHPEPAQVALAGLNADQNTALFIGDAEFDILCGSQAGTDTCLIQRHYTPVDNFKKTPDYIIHNLKELINGEINNE